LKTTTRQGGGVLQPLTRQAPKVARKLVARKPDNQRIAAQAKYEEEYRRQRTAERTQDAERALANLLNGFAARDAISGLWMLLLANSLGAFLTHGTPQDRGYLTGMGFALIAAIGAYLSNASYAASVARRSAAWETTAGSFQVSAIILAAFSLVSFGLGAAG
jgi:hypothetical protein